MNTIILPGGEEGRNRMAAVGFITALPKDRAWRVTIEPYRPLRTDQQNRYLWGVCYAEIMKRLDGWDAQDVHDYFLGEHFGWDVLEGLGPRKRVKPIRRSSKLNKQEFTDYVEFVRRKAAELGIFIPDPDTSP